MLLDLSDLDVILGIDWLAKCTWLWISIRRRWNLAYLGKRALIFQGDRSKVPNNLISMLSAWRLLSKRCRGFLAFVRDVKSKRRLREVWIVCQWWGNSPMSFRGNYLAYLQIGWLSSVLLCYRELNLFLYRHIRWLRSNLKSSRRNFRNCWIRDSSGLVLRLEARWHCLWRMMVLWYFALTISN